jgi:hypothetical protein
MEDYNNLAEVIGNCIVQLEEAVAQIPDCLLPDSLNEAVKRLRRAQSMVIRKSFRDQANIDTEKFLKNLRSGGWK